MALGLEERIAFNFVPQRAAITSTFNFHETSPHPTYFGKIKKNSERGFKNFCASYLGSDFVALDIGANIGVTSVILSHYLADGHVYAFEPGRTIFDKLKINASTLPNVSVERLAVADHCGTVTFAENTAYGHIAKEGDNVEAQTVDQIVARLGLERVDFIKIDVEGYESQVFQGAQETIQRFNPIIYFEFNSWCLMAYGDGHPLQFLRENFGPFPVRMRMEKDESIRDLSDLDSEEATLLVLHDNIVNFDSLNNLIVCNHQLTPSGRQQQSAWLRMAQQFINARRSLSEMMTTWRKSTLKARIESAWRRRRGG
eukprot:s1_g194.t1